MRQTYLVDRIRYVMHRVLFTDRRQLKTFFSDFANAYMISGCINDLLYRGEITEVRMYLAGEPFEYAVNADVKRTDKYIDLLTVRGNEAMWSSRYSREQLLDIYRAFVPIANYKTENVRDIFYTGNGMRYAISTEQNRFVGFTVIRDIADVLQGYTECERYNTGSPEMNYLNNIAVIPLGTSYNSLIPALIKNNYKHIAFVDAERCAVTYVNLNK